MLVSTLKQPHILFANRDEVQAFEFEKDFTGSVVVAFVTIAKQLALAIATFRLLTFLFA